MSDTTGSRRGVLLGAAGALLLAGCSKVTGRRPNAPGNPSGATAEEDENAASAAAGDAVYAVSPAEDLLREHGVTNRILLIYEESARRLDSGLDLPDDALLSTIEVARRFVEQYHSRLEEDYVYPRFEAAQSLTELTAVLRRQHQAGARINEQLARAVGLGVAESPAGRGSASALMRSYVRMFRAHEAREDTVLIPAMRSVMNDRMFEDLYDARLQRETDVLGADGVLATVDEIAALERTFEIRDLAQFTARV